ncbi:hypothetical protein C8J57DRAFT_233457 [Mycena rebaudengoi]|nr:hypothetical protein C8J57DRAFT_233457 [Mycena rebaudengoi]
MGSTATMLDDGEKACHRCAENSGKCACISLASHIVYIPSLLHSIAKEIYQNMDRIRPLRGLPPDHKILLSLWVNRRQEFTHKLAGNRKSDGRVYIRNLKLTQVSVSTGSSPFFVSPRLFLSYPRARARFHQLVLAKSTDARIVAGASVRAVQQAVQNALRIRVWRRRFAWRSVSTGCVKGVSNCLVIRCSARGWILKSPCEERE